MQLVNQSLEMLEANKDCKNAIFEQQRYKFYETHKEKIKATGGFCYNVGRHAKTELWDYLTF